MTLTTVDSYPGATVSDSRQVNMNRFRNPRKPKRLRPVVIPTQPQPWEYKPPRFADEYNESLNLPDAGHQLKIRRCMYRNRVVDFAVVQVFFVARVSHQVAKIDCCFGKVHRHQYVRSSGEDLFDHDALIVIPQRDPYATVDEWYDRSLDMMVYEWDDNFRRWNDVADE
jgi:hypothetical protein